MTTDLGPFSGVSPLVSAAVRELLELVLRLLAGVVVFVGFWLLSALIHRLLRSVADRSSSAKREVILLAEKMARVGLLLIGGVCALGTTGIDVSALVAGLGLTGFALGFALRDALSNFLSGALILSTARSDAATGFASRTSRGP